MNNVFSSVKKALHHIQHRDDAQEEWDSVVDPHKREILRYYSVFTGANYSVDEKVDALQHIGHNCYVGGREAAKGACRVLPHMLATLKAVGEDGLPTAPVSLRMQVLRTLSEILQASRPARHILQQDAQALQTLVELIADVTHVRECRWACYNLYLLIHSNVPMLKHLKESEEVRQSLEYAMMFPVPWLAWGCNLADLILKLLGLRHPRDRPAIT